MIFILIFKRYSYAPATWVSRNLKLIDLRGADCNDPKWDELLNQLALSEMGNLIALVGYQTLATDSIEKYRTNDCGGPDSINNSFTGEGSVGFPAGVMIAATWNSEPARASARWPTRWTPPAGTPPP